MQNHPFLESLQEHKQEIFEVIRPYLDNKILGISELKNEAKEEFHKKLYSEYPFRMGKYFRPTLVWIMTKALGGDYKKSLLTAAAIQLSEEWILIHDDVEDGSEKRRGEPALQKMYSVALAVNAGDALHVMMWKMLRDNMEVLGPEKAVEIMDEFGRMLSRTILGQTAEISWFESEDFDLGEEEVNFIMDGKTGYYTVAGPLRLGAILGCTDKSKLEKILTEIDVFGTYLGRAFQIIDDVLDVTTDFSGLKKQIGNDIYESKRTLLLVHLLSSCNKNERDVLVKILSLKREEKNMDQVELVLKMMKDKGSVEYAKSKVETYCTNALLCLNDMDFFVNDVYKKKLVDCVDFVATRKH